MLIFLFVSTITFIVAQISQETDPNKLVVLDGETQIPFMMCSEDILNFQSNDQLTFTKINGDSIQWKDSSMSSCQAYRSGVHNFTVKILKSRSLIKTRLIVGVFNENFSLSSSYIGSDSNSWAFYCYNGNKYLKSKQIKFGQVCPEGSVISLIVDLSTQFGKMDVYLNNVPLGTAFQGFLKKGPVKFGFSLPDNDNQILISYQKIN